MDVPNTGTDRVMITFLGFSFEDKKYLLCNLSMQLVTHPTRTFQGGYEFELPPVILWHLVYMELSGGGSLDELLFG